MRKLKHAVELVSDIGALAVDLHNGYRDEDAHAAFVFLAKVNPQLFAWLKDRLVAASKGDQ